MRTYALMHLVAFQTQTQNRSVLAAHISQIATLPAARSSKRKLNRNFKSQIAARYAAFWHAIFPNRIGLFPLVPLNRSVLNRSVFKTQTQLNCKRSRSIKKSRGRFSATKTLYDARFWNPYLRRSSFTP